jgi:integrase/recombinase XerD
MHSHTFSIDFVRRLCRNEKSQAYLYARITVDGEIAEISLKERIKATDWDSKREMVKGKGTDARTINDH